MSGDTHAHALQNRDDDFDRLVRGKPCWPSLQFKREETKFLDGSLRFFSGSASRIRLGRCALVVLTRDLSADEWSTRCIVPLSIPALVRVAVGKWSSGRPLKAVNRDPMCTFSSAAAVTLIAILMKTTSGPQTGDRRVSRRSPPNRLVLAPAFECSPANSAVHRGSQNDCRGRRNHNNP
jgi:hypothetical protein